MKIRKKEFFYMMFFLALIKPFIFNIIPIMDRLSNVLKAGMFIWIVGIWIKKICILKKKLTVFLPLM